MEKFQKPRKQSNIPQTWRLFIRFFGLADKNSQHLKQESLEEKKKLDYHDRILYECRNFFQSAHFFVYSSLN